MSSSATKEQQKELSYLKAKIYLEEAPTKLQQGAGAEGVWRKRKPFAQNSQR
jgi:hypothetical protein